MRNPAAPVEVLLRLLDVAPLATCRGLEGRRDLPLPVQEAMLRHPSREVRSALAAHPGVDPEIRGRLLADADWLVTMRAFGRPGQRPVSDDVIMALMTRIEQAPPEPVKVMTIPELYGELWPAMEYDPRLFRIGATHPDPRVRSHVAPAASWIDESVREVLLDDPDPGIRALAVAAIDEKQRVMQPADLPDRHCHALWDVLQRPLSRALIDQVVAAGDESSLFCVAPNPTTPPDVVQALLRHPSARVRRQVAERADLSHEQLAGLAADPAVEVRTAVSVHPGLTERQRAGIDIDVTTADGHGHYGSRRRCRSSERHGDERVPALAEAVRWARSVNPLLRRRAARNPDLPVDQLAGDPDLGVRVLLALHHPGAAPALVLRCFLDHRGCGRVQLAELGQFPATGLAGFADHDDPVVRCLVARDPEADPEIIERLLADPDAAVRRAMAGCPRLPAARIVALLDDPELGEDAAANPALPADRMRQILDSVPAPAF